jgi:hypothetical protein
MNNILKFFIWLLFVMSTTTWGFNLINLSSTIANIIGLTIIVAVVYVSVKTKCFTIINFNNKQKKKENEE